MSLPGSGCKRGCGCKGLSVKPGLGTEGPLVPGWDFYPQTGGEREEGLLSYPPLALGSVGGLPLLPPSPKQLPAYLEESQAWNRISLSVFQHLLATEGLTFSKVSMNAGSTNRQSGRSSGSCGKEILLLPDEEVLLSGELVWCVGRRGGEAFVPGRLQRACPLPSPRRVCCAPRPCWRTGCVAPWLRRIALSSLWQRVALGEPRFASRHRSVLLEPLASTAASGAVVNAAVPSLHCLHPR